MNCEFDEAQRVIKASAAEVLAGAAPATAWQALAKAGLLALTLPSWLGGDDLGVLEAAVLLTEIGRRAAEVPALATIMLGALPVVRWGSREVQERVLAGVSEGDAILTSGVRERSTGMPDGPATTAVADQCVSATVTGTKLGVHYSRESNWILVPAAIRGGTSSPERGVVLVESAGPDVSMIRTPASGPTPEYTLRLDAAHVAAVLGADDVA